jgi:hypothetical protein
VKRTVVSFMPRVGSRVDFALIDAPTNIPGLRMNEAFDCVEFATAVTATERGAALLAALRRHVPVQAGLDAALMTPIGGGSAPLYFRVDAEAADALPWEELWVDETTGFAALDRRWPVVRIAGGDGDGSVRVFEAPLRIVAVLSAAGAGLTGLPQLNGVLRAVAGSAAPAEVAVHVISGEEEVLTAAAAGGATAELIAPDAPGLARQITAAKPDLLHVLAHGGAEAGMRILSFGTTTDFDNAALGSQLTGSVRLKVDALAEALLPHPPYLLVLSACETAQAGSDGVPRAIAHDLVDRGIPAVIGMRRPVDLGAANRLCEALYPEVLATVQSVLATAVNSDQEISWAETLTDPRLVLGGGSPPVRDSWTDPVLYVQAGRLRVRRVVSRPAVVELSAPERAAAQAKLDQFRGVLATLDPTQADAAALVAGLRAQIVKLEGVLAR